MSFVDQAALQEHIGSNVHILPVQPPRKTIRATPAPWIEPEAMPTRSWLYGRHLIRKFVSGTVAPGGTGKSVHALTELVAMASGLPLLGVQTRERLRGWYYNLEDPNEEAQRRLAAICRFHGVTRDDLGDRLFMDSGRDQELIVATETRDGVTVAEPVVEDLIATIRENAIDVLVIDPFVSCHSVGENDNGAIDRVVKTFGRIAEATNCAIDLIHHVRKSEGGKALTVEDGRGAVAFLGGVRSARVFNRMSKEEAEEMGVSAEDRIDFFRLDQGKANMSRRPASAIWRRLVGVGLGNGQGGPEDIVGVPVAWKPEDGACSARPKKRSALAPAEALVMRALGLMIDYDDPDLVPAHVPEVRQDARWVSRTDLRRKVEAIGYGDAPNKESVRATINRNIRDLIGKQVLRQHIERGEEMVWAV